MKYEVNGSSYENDFFYYVPGIEIAVNQNGKITLESYVVDNFLIRSFHLGKYIIINDLDEFVMQATQPAISIKNHTILYIEKTLINIDKNQLLEFIHKMKKWIALQ